MPAKSKPAKKPEHLHVAAAEGYIEGVLSGKIPACKWVKLACERHRRDIKSSKSKAFPYRFDPEKGDRPCRFFERLPHVKGKWAAKDPLTRKRITLKLQPWQSFIFVSIFGWVRKDNGKRRFRKARVYVPRKNGKALALDTLVPTPSGWTTFDQIKPGDTVFHPSGEPINVVAVTDVQHDRPCYRVNFSNGESVVADANHEWLTTARVNMPGVRKCRSLGAMRRVRTTLEIFETQTYGARADRNHSMDMPDPIECEHIKLDIPPYSLGAWLGDGHTSAAAITFDPNDSEIFNSIIADGFPMRERPSQQNGKAKTWGITLGRTGRIDPGSFTEKLKNAELIGNKRIPRQYLRASFDQRLALLQGMMDTDGTISKNGRVISFTTIKKDLADDIGELLATFGIKYSIIGNPMKCNGRDVPGTAYDVQFMAFRESLPCFRIKRKLDRMRLASEQSISSRSRSVQIESVEHCESEPVRCIQVSSPDGLFLFGKTMLPTHNSFIAAAVGWWMLALDGEAGAEVYAGATSEQQAGKVFQPARQMTIVNPDLPKKFGVTVNAHSLTLTDGSIFKPIIGKPGDGDSPHCAIIDEYHEHPTSDQLDTMETGMGAREQPLSLVISTAGSNAASPCREDWRNCELILLNKDGFRDETTFAIIFTIDEGDQWDTEAALIKANPNWGVSIEPAAMLADLQAAKQRANRQSSFKTKHLNEWVSIKEAFFNIAEWERLGNPKLTPADFKDYPCFLSGDLASKHDLVALMQLFCLPDKRFALFGRYYLPAATINLPENQHYRNWRIAGWIQEAGDDVTDLEQFKDDVIDLCGEYQVEEMPSDPNRAWGVYPALVKEGVPIVEYRNTVLTMSEPMKELDAMIRSGRIVHNGDPVLAWAIGNTTGRIDKKDNVFPNKETNANKIDPVVGAIMAIGRAMLKDDNSGPVFAW